MPLSRSWLPIAGRPGKSCAGFIADHDHGPLLCIVQSLIQRPSLIGKYANLVEVRRNSHNCPLVWKKSLTARISPREIAGAAAATSGQSVTDVLVIIDK